MIDENASDEEICASCKKEAIERMRSEKPRFWTLEQIDELESGKVNQLRSVVRVESCGPCQYDTTVTYDVMESGEYEFDGIVKDRFRTVTIENADHFCGGYEGREKSEDVEKLKRLIEILQDAVVWLEQPPYSQQ